MDIKSGCGYPASSLSNFTTHPFIFQGIERDGYVPNLMPGEIGSDYVDIEIDLDTGQLLNWETPSAKDIQEFIEENKV